MTNVLTLKKLQKFARQNPKTVFDLSSDRGCLACQAANAVQPGHVMTGWTYFEGHPKSGGYTQVDVYYAALCRELHHREINEVSGADLDTMIERLIHGTHPRQVADEYAELHAS